MRMLAIGLASMFILAGNVDATERTRTQVNRFKAAHPCPVTHKARGPCPGYVVDHVVPLCAGGHDRPANMQWQSLADAKIKDRAERAQCRRR